MGTTFLETPEGEKRGGRQSEDENSPPLWESLLDDEREAQVREMQRIIEATPTGARNRIDRIREGCLMVDTPLRDIPSGVAVMKTDRGVRMILGEDSFLLPERTVSGRAGSFLGKPPEAATDASRDDLAEFERQKEESPFLRAIEEDIKEEGLEEEAALIGRIQEKILPSSVRTPEELREGILSGRISSKVHRIYDRHAEIRRRIFLGHSSAEIARDLDLSATTVREIKNSPIIQEQLRQLHIHSEASAMKIHKEIQKMAPKALETLEGIMMSEDAGHAIRLKAAIDVLDRAGHKPVTKTEASIKSMSMTLGAEDIASLKRRAVEAAKEAGTILEADIVDNQA